MVARRWQFVTAAFAHASWEHLSSNIFMLYVFGRIVEVGAAALTFAPRACMCLLASSVGLCHCAASASPGAVQEEEGALGVWATYLICSVGPFTLACLRCEAASTLLPQENPSCSR